MSHLPHPDSNYNHQTVTCAVVTVSDTRTIETDKSGAIIQQLLKDNNQKVADYKIIKDEPTQIQEYLKSLTENKQLNAVISMVVLVLHQEIPPTMQSKSYLTKPYLALVKYFAI